eukprot:scaffold142555_cov20-Tisochrysis_lutea.AAC.2
MDLNVTKCRATTHRQKPHHQLCIVMAVRYGQHRPRVQYCLFGSIGRPVAGQQGVQREAVMEVGVEINQPAS